ncbi:DUF2934 domain-containing protein [Affinirhizobium pseudoryzae]|uniref:DUF2934 domain-containing protein n=1 Tax=Allorhizobium pseudoryzae TaxID=379684 RepID=UPI0013EC5DE3|nr:DUF2934 domain-containing protein [Allorhizobium pseudoryzae]
MAVSEEWIKNRAYALWEEEGRPHGKDAEHWERAAQEYKTVNGGAKKAPAARKSKAADAKPADAKPAATAETKPAAKPAARAKAAPKAKEAPASEAAPKKRARKTPGA